MKIILCLFLVLFLVSCEKKNKFAIEEKSEMAQLMLAMHSEMVAVQVKIKAGEDLGKYPEKFDNVVSAPMTDESMREESWESYAQTLIAAEKSLYQAKPEEQQQAYKDVVSSCLACHTSVGCAGPIPKIKKLHWKE